LSPSAAWHDSLSARSERFSVVVQEEGVPVHLDDRESGPGDHLPDSLTHAHDGDCADLFGLCLRVLFKTVRRARIVDLEREDPVHGRVTHTTVSTPQPNRAAVALAPSLEPIAARHRFTATPDDPNLSTKHRTGPSLVVRSQAPYEIARAIGRGPFEETRSVAVSVERGCCAPHRCGSVRQARS
jgi:hypothetical protein